MSAKLGMKRRKKLAKPRNDLTSFGDLGVGQSTIAHAFSVLGLIPSLKYSKRRCVVELIPKEHLEPLSVNPAACSQPRTRLRSVMWESNVSEKIIQSST